MAEKIKALYGVTPVEAALLAGKRKLIRLWMKTDGKNPRFKAILKLAKEAHIQVSEATSEQLFKLTDSKMHQGLALECGPLEPVPWEDFLQTKPRLLVALDQIEDPQNLGAICRTAAFLGAGGLLIPKDHSAPFSAAASKASAGAMEWFPMALVGNLAEALDRLKSAGYWVYGAQLDETSQPLAQALLAPNMVLVLGNEGSGLRKLTTKRCDHLITIPGHGQMESLNVSASAAILIHHFMSMPDQC